MKRALLSVPVLAFLLLPNCGGDDSSGSNSAAVLATCKKACEKMNTCFSGQGLPPQDCDKNCSSYSSGSGSGGGSGATANCDTAKLKSKFDECLDVSCDQLLACVTEAASICSSSPGTGGAGPGSGGGGPLGGAPPGGGGTPGSGGGLPGLGGALSFDPSTCSACDAASICCRRLNELAGQPTTGCEAFSAASCESDPNKSAIIPGCATLAGQCH